MRLTNNGIRRWLMAATALAAIGGVNTAARAQESSVHFVVQDTESEDEDDDEDTPQLPETVVPAERDDTQDYVPGESFMGPLDDDPFSATGDFGTQVEGPFLPDVQGTRINEGKKTVNIELDEQPSIIENNYRQGLMKAPGLFLSEESTPLVAIGYRGLNPDRNSFMQVMEDGIPISANIFGFNESYYLPPFQVVDHIEFLHGGSALMYGPQPGGALNFVTQSPSPGQPITFTSQNGFGSHNLFSTYEAVSGMSGPIGFYGYGLHRDSNGFRDFNSWYDLDYGGAKVIFDLTQDSRLIVHANRYTEAHGEPGRLTRAAFEANPGQANRRFDYFDLYRDFVSVTHQQVIDDSTLLETKVWGNDFSRFSRRQRGGGFGTAPTGTQSDFRLQEFQVFGVDSRLRTDYALFNSDDLHTFSGGVLYYYNDGMRHDSRGEVQGGGKIGPEPRAFTDLDTSYVSFFAENCYRFGALSVTPGIRLDNVRQSVTELVNVNKTAANQPLGDVTDNDFIPLLGLGSMYIWDDGVQSYANISQSYRPKVFEQNVSPNVGESISGDLEPGDAYIADTGLRLNPVPYFMVDSSVFYMEFNDQIGTIAGVIQNVGDSVHKGVEFASEFDVVSWRDALNGTSYAEDFGSLGVLFNTMLLNAEFIRGPVTGKAPQYAPDYVIRSGLSYTYHDLYWSSVGSGGGDAYAPNNQTNDVLKLWFTNTFVGRHFGDDANSPDFFVPSYKVWDLTGQVQLTQSIGAFGGIYNVFDEQYFGRVVGSGIEPADGRNFFCGMRGDW